MDWRFFFFTSSDCKVSFLDFWSGWPDAFKRKLKYVNLNLIKKATFFFKQTFLLFISALTFLKDPKREFQSIDHLSWRKLC